MTNIMVVDDEPHVVRLLNMSLKRAGYGVITARDGREALEKIRAQRPDVLLTDIEMGGISGIELCRKIDEEMPDRAFAIYIMTSRAEQDYRDWYDNMRNIHFLEKPLSTRQLVASIEAHRDAAEGIKRTGQEK